VVRRDELLDLNKDLQSKRDELAAFLFQCDTQLRAIQGAPITHFLTATIGMLSRCLRNLWEEVRVAKESNLQDPCRMMTMSSASLLDREPPPYTSMVEASSEWVAERRYEVRRTRSKIDTMLDSDLLLLWINHHLTQAQMVVNQEKIEATLFGKLYRYDDPSTAYPAHVRSFYSNEHSLSKRAENFTTSLADSEVLLRLLGQIAPNLCEVDILSHVDLETRSKKLLRLLDALNKDVASLITPMDLTHSFSPDLTAALIARLMMSYPTMPMDTSIFRGAAAEKKRSRYASENRSSQHAGEHGMMGQQAEELAAMSAEVGMSATATAKAQQLLAESARIDAMTAEEEQHTHGGTMPAADGTLRPGAAAGAGTLNVSHAGSKRNNAISGTGQQNHEEDEMERSIRQCGPFTDLLRSLYMVNRELTTKGRVELKLVEHVSASVRKVLSDVRTLLDDAYERHALWMSIRRRVASFVTMVLSQQMRQSPLLMQDRQAIRAIRRYTKLLDREGKPQSRFRDLLHPWNRTSNDQQMMMNKKQKKQTIHEDQSDGEDEDGQVGGTGAASVGAGDGVHEKAPSLSRVRSRARSRRSSFGSEKGVRFGVDISDDDDEDDDDEYDKESSIGRPGRSSPASLVSFASVSSSSGSEDESVGDLASISSDGGDSRTSEGADVWKPYKLISPQALAAMPKAEADRILRRLRNRQETMEDLTNQLTFELGKIQEMIAKHYTAIRDIYRAYAQLDNSTELEFQTKIDKRNQNAIKKDIGPSSNNSSNTYSASDAQPRFSIHEYALLLRDCKLLNRVFTKKRADRIFEYVWSRDYKAVHAQAASGGLSSSGLAASELMVKDRARMEVDCRQFVEILIRVAHQRMPTTKEREELLEELEVDREMEAERRRTEGSDPIGTSEHASHHNATNVEVSDSTRHMDALTRGSPDPAPPPVSSRHNNNTQAFEYGTPLFPTTRPGLALRLFALLRCRLIPHASRLNIDHFRSQYKRVEVSTLYKKHGAMMRKLFYKYAKMHVGKNRSSVAAASADNLDHGTSSSASSSIITGEDGSDHVIWTTSLDYKEFVQLLRESKVLDGKYLTLRQVYAIFANCSQQDLVRQHEHGGGGGGAGGGGAGGTAGKSGRKGKKGKKVDGMATPGRALSRAVSRAPTRPSSPSAADSSREKNDGSSIAASLSLLGSLNLQATSATSSSSPQDDSIAAGVQTAHTELIFPEFLECFAAVASIRHPNPFKPLHQRLQHFLERDIQPWFALTHSKD